MFPTPVDTAVTVVFHSGGESRRRLLQANGIYGFHAEGHKLDLFQQPLAGLPANRPASKPPRSTLSIPKDKVERTAPGPRNEVCTIPVKILVDDKEPTVQRIWEKRYRQRVADASKIIERHCRVRFEVVAVDTWTSDGNARDLWQLIEEFERKIKPAPARLAIGFTGQYQTLRDDKHLGGTRGPFRPHILIREWVRQMAEPERLEALVHELGHFLGAVHSPEHQSVMRPDISDRQSRARDFHVGFDAPNTMAVYLVGEELRGRPLALGNLCQLSSATKEQLRAVYRTLAAALPNDPAAPHFLAMLDQSLGLAGETPERHQAVIAGARSVVRAVCGAAEKNRQQTRLDGDKLTEHYIRQAAVAARRLPQEVAREAFLLGLGVALDDSALLRDTPIVGNLWRSLESEPERAARLAVLGVPTMHARHDLGQHFAVSAGLTVLVGPQNTEGVGILKELADSRGGTGFSFADLSADLAGVVFAVGVGDGRIPLSRLENDFKVRDYLPEPAGLKEGIVWDDFVKSYGFPPDARLSQERESLRGRILALPGYK